MTPEQKAEQFAESQYPWADTLTRAEHIATERAYIAGYKALEADRDRYREALEFVVEWYKGTMQTPDGEVARHPVLIKAMEALQLYRSSLLEMDSSNNDSGEKS